MYFCVSEFWTLPTRCTCVHTLVYQHLIKQYHFSFVYFCIGYILIKLDTKYYSNVTSYKSFINKVYDLVGQPSYMMINQYRKQVGADFSVFIGCKFIIAHFYRERFKINFTKMVLFRVFTLKIFFFIIIIEWTIWLNLYLYSCDLSFYRLFNNYFSGNHILEYLVLTVPLVVFNLWMTLTSPHDIDI